MGNRKIVEENTYVGIRVFGLTQDTVRQLRNVASHLGVNMSHMLKPVIRNFLLSQPERYRLTNANKDDDIDKMKALQLLEKIAEERGVTILDIVSDLQ